MLISLCIIFILSLIIDLASYQREEEQESIIRSLARRTVTWSLLIIVLLIYVIDKIDGQYIWTAFLVGIIFFVTLEIIIPRKAYIYVLQVIGIVTLGGFLAFMTTVFRYELQHQFFKPCWSSDSKRIAFFMQKNLIQYKLGIPFSLWSPNTIWSKNYLCTMDYDGKNFKQIKQTEQVTDEISWSGSGEIVYTQVIMQDINTILQSKILATNTDGKETGTLYETAKIPTKTPIKENGRILDPWVSKDRRYLGFILNYREPKKTNEEDIRLGRYYDNYELIVKDLKTQQNKIDILQRDVKSGEYEKFFGAFKENKIAHYSNEMIIVIDLDRNITDSINISKYKHNVNLPMFDTWDVSGRFLIGWWDKLDILNKTIERLSGYKQHTPEAIAPYGELGASSWNMIIGDRNKIISSIVIKTRRSYLFNIFREIGD